MTARSPNRYLLAGAAVTYLIVLTLCLVTQNPFWIAGSRQRTARWMFEQFISPVSHLLAFLIAGLLCGLACTRSMRAPVLGILACYALATEGLQFLIPDRTPEWSDLLQNMLGVCLGMGLVTWLRRHEVPTIRPQGGAPH